MRVKSKHGCNCFQMWHGSVLWGVCVCASVLQWMRQKVPTSWINLPFAPFHSSVPWFISQRTAQIRRGRFRHGPGNILFTANQAGMEKNGEEPRDKGSVLHGYCCPGWRCVKSLKIYTFFISIAKSDTKIVEKSSLFLDILLTLFRHNLLQQNLKL